MNLLVFLMWIASPEIGEGPEVHAGAETSAGRQGNESSSEGGGARPLGDAIVVEGGASCVDHDRLVGRVGEWLGKNEIDERLQVIVRGDPSDPRKLEFTLQHDGEEQAVRRFDPAPERCSDLHAIVGLAIALAIDATLLETVTRKPPEAEPEPKPKPPQVVEPKPEPKPEPEPPPASRSRPRLWQPWLELGGGVGFGAPPSLSGVGRLGASARWNDLVDLRLGVLGASAGVQRVAEGAIAMSSFGGAVGICVGPRVVRFLRLRGCAELLAGAAVATGQGFEQDARITLPWVASTFGGDFIFGVGKRVELGVGGDWLVNLVTPGFDFVAQDGGRRVAREFPRFGGLVTVDLGIRVW